MKSARLGFIAAAAGITLAAPVEAQSRPRLHVNPRWEECAIQLDAALTQAAWRQFAREAGQVVYFRPLTGARPMGRGRFEVSFMQWQTNMDDTDPAWNDTFVHPDSAHWLYEGSGLKFPGLSFRAGVGSRTDVGGYFTRNVQSNYGVYALQVQHNLVQSGPHDWDISARASITSLYGPEDVDLRVYGLDLVVSRKPWAYRGVRAVPYAGLTTYLASAHEKSAAVSLADERVLGAMATAGVELRYSVMRLAAEAGMSRLPSFSVKFGIGR